MQQIVQDLGRGKLRVLTVPDPVATPGRVVIANVASLISAGTEKGLRELAQKSLLDKARERPDHVRRVLEKVRQEGLLNTVAQVRSTLAEVMTLGYSSSGVVVACGAGVQGVQPGDRVASNGPHAGVVSVPRHLCARVPDGVDHECAAFAVVGSIALQAVRLAELRLGETAFVVGLGLVGQLAVALLRAAGCRVLGTDLDAAKCDLALRMGAAAAAPDLGAREVGEQTGGLGADAVLVAASTPSDRPLSLAADAVRKRGRVVVVGAVGMDLPRPPFYAKEAELVVSCSYGPGRYDPLYEERGLDYPAPYVRWTEQRNLQAVLDLMAGGALDVAPLITHRFEIERAAEAYELIERGAEPFVGVLLRYPEVAARRPSRRLELPRAPVPSRSAIGVGLLGAGAFAGGVLIPAIRRCRRLEPRVLCSARGLAAAVKGERFGFASATSDEDAVFADPAVAAVFIATRHDLHAGQVIKALRAGKHVFVEKPLALTAAEIAEVEEVVRELAAREPRGSPVLMVGFNRRFSPAARAVKAAFAGVAAPLTVSVRFNAGAIPADHWVQDEAVGGGRIVGEACHAIDLATYLTGSPPVRVFAESIGGPRAPAVTDDQSFLTVRHADGSVSGIGYLAGGDRAFGKERVEVFGGGRVGVIDDFRRVVTVAGGRTRRRRSLQQDKGHRAEVERFAEAVAAGGPPPIPWEELRAVSLASILAVRSLREGVPFEVP